MFLSFTLLSLVYAPLFIKAENVLARHAPLITPAPVALNARQLTTITTCAAGATACADGTGCCDVGKACTVDTQNRPICGGGCGGGPQCSAALEGLCCEIGYTCDYQASLCQTNTLIISTGTIDLPVTEEPATTTATATVIPGSTIETTAPSSTSSTSSTTTASTSTSSAVTTAEISLSSSALTVTVSTSAIAPNLPALPSAGTGTSVIPVDNATAPSASQPSAATFTGGAAQAVSAFGFGEMVVGSILAYIVGMMG